MLMMFSRLFLSYLDCGGLLLLLRTFNLPEHHLNLVVADETPEFDNRFLAACRIDRGRASGSHRAESRRLEALAR